MNYTIISVQFKNKNKEFVGKTYDYLLNKTEDKPCRGDIIRLMDKNYNWLCYGTRVKITDVLTTESAPNLQEVTYVKSSMD